MHLNLQKKNISTVIRILARYKKTSSWLHLLFRIRRFSVKFSVLFPCWTYVAHYQKFILTKPYTVKQTLVRLLLLTVEIHVIVVLQFRYLQQMQLVALYLEMERYISLHLYGLLYFRRIGDFIGESLILSRLRKILLLEAHVNWWMIENEVSRG